MAEAPTFGETPKNAQSKKVPSGQLELDSLISASKQTESTVEQGKKPKETWYTVSSGIEYRTGPLGSDSGEFLGRAQEPMKIRRVGNSVSRHNGVASICAIVEYGGELRQAWFNLKDVRKVRSQKAQTSR